MTTEELLVKISADISELKKELQKGKEEVDKFGKEGKSSFEEFNGAMSKVGSVANKAMKVAATAIIATTTALLALGASTKEFRTNQAKLETAFESAGSSAEQAKNTYNDLYRVLGDDGQAVEAANHLAKLTTNQKDLEQWTTICQGVYASFGDSLPIESLTEAANETAKTGALTGALADALNWAGVNEEDFQAKLDACNTEAEREALIRGTLNGLYTDAATKYEETAGDILAQNEAQARLNEATAKLGEVVAPINAAFTEFGAILLEKITPAIQDFVENHGKKLSKVLETVAEVIGEIVGWISDNIDLVGTVAGVILAIVAAINLYNAAMAIYNIVMAPVNLTILGIVAAIVALIAIITACIVYWDEIKAAAVACWEWIKDAWNSAATWFDETIIQPIVGFFSDMWDGLTQGAKDAWEGIKKVFSTVANFFKNIFSNAWNGVKKVFSVGGKIFDGIKEGILTAFKTVVNAIIKGINKVVKIPFEGINKVLSKIHGLSIAGIKPFSWLTWRAPVPQIPMLAKGGIVDSATLAMIGERGKEAVVPLENNTEWIDMLAGRLSAAIGGNNTPIILQVDGKTFGEISVNSINQLTRQKGRLALNLV